MIEVKNFRKAYPQTASHEEDEGRSSQPGDRGGFLAVDDLSFSVGPGEVLGLIGPNGAGKTTTLRAMCGLIVPSEGTLSVCGMDVEKQPVEVKKRLTYIPDDPPLFTELTVEQHLQFTGSVFGVSNVKERIHSLLKEFSLLDKRNTRASDLSRGMRQKLAICCGYLHDPDVILLDEPMTGLDPHGIRTLKDSIRRLAGLGAAVIVSSHLLAMVEDICSHVLILKRGRQKYWGTLEGLKSSYVSDADQATLEEIFFRATEMDSVVEFQL